MDNRPRAPGDAAAAVGLVEVTSVEETTADVVSATDARRCGCSSLDGLVAFLDQHPKRPVFRADLALELGLETLAFERDVRKLKELGLTESLEIGYRLSPRGRAFVSSP